MSAERQYKLSCDGPNCRDWIIVKVDTVARARKQARKDGWRSREGRDYCRAHRP